MAEQDDDNTTRHDITPDDNAEPAAVSENLAAMQRQVDELKDKLLRSVADYQNFARRSRQDVMEARDQAAFELARPLVDVVDHFDRALEVDPQKSNTETLLKGVRMVRDELIKTLEGFGVTRLNVRVGDEFNPKNHEALMQQESSDHAPNHVAALLQPGYAFKERTLRPAKVSVTK